jgi:hypothetical protein
MSEMRSTGAVLRTDLASPESLSQSCRIIAAPRSLCGIDHSVSYASQPERAPETQGAHAQLLVGDVPDAGKPGLERQIGRCEDRPRRDRRLPAARVAAPKPARELPRLRRPAARADKALRPAQASEVGEAGQLVREPGLELTERARVLETADRTCGSENHPANLGVASPLVVYEPVEVVSAVVVEREP